MSNPPQAELIKGFSDFFEIYEKVQQHLSLKETDRQSIVEAKRWLGRLEQEEFPVAFLGTYSAGKSTIINAILGEPILPENTRPTTAVPTYVRKGTEDKAIVYYLDKNAKFELRGLLLKKVSSQLGETLAIPPEPSELPTFLQKLDQRISNVKLKNPNFDSKFYDKLKCVCDRWDDFTEEEKDIKISDLENYTEESQETLFIDRIEVYLSSVGLEDNVVLADLPGLGVVNKKHIKITKDFIKEKAKAFVVCIMPSKVLEGEELEFLDEINKSNPAILQRSFWVINKWDLQTKEQKIQDENQFKDQQQKYNFNFDITKKRLFKVSALKFLLLKQVAEEKSDTKLVKNHGGKILGTDSMSPNDAKRIIQGQEEEVVSNFAEFKAELFAYLNQTAREEFLTDAKSELARVCSTVIGALPEPQQLENEELQKRVVVNRELKNYIKSLENKVRDWMKQVRNRESFSLWQQKYQQEVEEHIDKLMSANREEFLNKMRTGIDIQENLARLPLIIEEELKFNHEVRSQLVKAAREGFTEKYLDRLLLELREVNKDYFSEKILEALKDKLNERDITMRLYGLADYLLYYYSETLENISLDLKSCTGSLEERLGNALQKYRDGLRKYADELKNNLNKYMDRSIKNHAEYLENELIQLFDESQHDIYIIEQIDKSVDISKEIEREKQKQSLIKGASDKLNEILKQL